jgi:hypothetical protein
LKDPKPYAVRDWKASYPDTPQRFRMMGWISGLSADFHFEPVRVTAEPRDLFS